MGKALPVGRKIIEQGRSSVQQALLPFYFGGSEFELFTGVLPKGREILAFARTPREDPALAGTPESEE